MKVAQLLATIPDALPKEYVQELAQLQANAPAMGWPFVRRRMAGELGTDWQTKFRDFEKTAARAASLGQVHRATALDGRPLACKLQYPDMASAVEADLRQLKLAMGLYERYDRAVTTAEIHAEIADRLREELDYEREAAHMRLYGEILRGEPGVAVPVPLPELSTRRLLTMTWLDGAPILDVAEQAPLARAQRDRAADVPDLVRAVLLLRRHSRRPASRQLHGRAGRAPSICSISAASASSVPRSCAASSISTTRCSATIATSPFTPIESWGFGNLSREMIDVLNRWALFVYGPLLDDRERLIQEKAKRRLRREVAESVHRDIRRLGGVRPPREFVFMDRAAIGLGSVFMHLKAEINWYRLFHELIDDFDEAAARRPPAAALAALAASASVAAS